jgi:tetratricopeptide (TPR) repeat protein
VVTRFPNDYGIHANLGTAYHLLGRYVEAEKHIARDLEINPDAHFGLEKYHLALLQYLMRDAKYQSRHVYVDEFTYEFIYAGHGLFRFSESTETYSRKDAQLYTNGLVEAEADFESFLKLPPDDSNFRYAMKTLAALDDLPAYRSKWNLAANTNLQEGVIYMASLNPKEPACFTMLGVVSWKYSDLNLTVKAFEKAIALGSPEKTILEAKVKSIRKHIETAKPYRASEILFSLVIACGIAFLAIVVFRAIVRFVRR